MDKLSKDEQLTWEVLKHGLADFELVTMMRYPEPHGDVEIFLYVHNEIHALHYTKIMVDGIEVEEVDFIAQYEPDTRYHHVEMFRPFHFQAIFKW